MQEVRNNILERPSEGFGVWATAVAPVMERTAPNDAKSSTVSRGNVQGYERLGDNTIEDIAAKGLVVGVARRALAMSSIVLSPRRSYIPLNISS